MKTNLESCVRGPRKPIMLREVSVVLKHVHSVFVSKNELKNSHKNCFDEHQLVPRAFSAFKMAARRRNRWTRLKKKSKNRGVVCPVTHD